MPCPGRPLLLSRWALVVCLCLAPAVHARPDARTIRWAEAILLRSEYGKSSNACGRWVKSPTLSVFGGTAFQQRMVGEVVAHINETLARTPIRGIRLRRPNDRQADIRVYFAPLRRFHRLATQNGFQYVKGNWGFFSTTWNSKYQIQRATVLLAADKLTTPPLLRHFALEEIVQSLGLSNDSPLFRDSIFFETPNDPGIAQRLSKRDRKLIRLFYKHVRPGARRRELRAALMRHW